MAVPFEKVVDGTIKFINTEIISGMTEWQELLARLAIERVIGNGEAVKSAVVNNGIVRTFGVVDSDGMIDIDALAADIKKQISAKGKLTVKIPIFGTLTFRPEDVDTIHNFIIGG